MIAVDITSRVEMEFPHATPDIGVLLVMTFATRALRDVRAKISAEEARVLGKALIAAASDLDRTTVVTTETVT